MPVRNQIIKYLNIATTALEDALLECEEISDGSIRKNYAATYADLLSVFDTLTNIKNEIYEKETINS